MPDPIAPSDNARALAVEKITEWLALQTYPDRMMADVASHRAFVMEVVYGVIRWRRPLEWIIQQTSKRSPQGQIRSILLVALYELLYMRQDQDYATIHEAVSLAKIDEHPSVGNYVNAILRRVQRERALWLDRITHQPPAIRLSHPDLLFKRWTQAWGEERAVALCEWNNQPAEVFIRCQRTQISTDAFDAELRSAGIHATPLEADKRFFSLPRGVRVQDVPGYEAGWFVVQDPATMHAVDLLHAQPGESVLDACAAPGGKTVALWDAMQGEGRLVAADSSETRLATMRQTLKRMHCEGVEIKKADATQEVADGELFDAVLLDAPCTNTGVIRRRPDARWRFSKNFLQQCINKQKDLLTACSRAVRPGGRLVYSTCSVEAEENEVFMDRWLAWNPAYEKAATRQCFPPDSGTDGAYAVVLKRAP